MSTGPKLSVVVNFSDMRREADRTLYSLSAFYQTEANPTEYEVIAVETGSSPQLSTQQVTQFGEHFSHRYYDARAGSAIASLNDSVGHARGRFVLVLFDGLRILTPGIVGSCLKAFSQFKNAFVVTVGFDLGRDRSDAATTPPYNEAVEDQLLTRAEWRSNGYRLFGLGPGLRHGDMGWFGPLIESDCFALRKDAFQQNRFNVRFSNNLVCLDFCQRMLRMDGMRHIVLLGEGTFRQLHSTAESQSLEGQARWSQFEGEFRRIYGRPCQRTYRRPYYLGQIPPEADEAAQRSAEVGFRWWQKTSEETAGSEGSSVDVARAVAFASRLRRSGRLEEAADVYRSTLRTQPENADALFHLGAIELQTGAFLSAVTHLERVFQQRPEHAIAALALGAAQDSANQFERAISSYEHAVRLDPGLVSAHKGLGTALRKAGRCDDALASCHRALQLSPDDVEAQHLVAQVLQEQGEFEEALLYHERALRSANVVRCQVLQAVIARLRAHTYLELGVDTGENLRRVLAHRKLAVDPIPPAPLVKSEVAGGRATYFEMTSDQFFAEHEAVLRERPIDVAFIDGLHTCEQALADVENCLRFLADNGVILLHDCNPTTAAMATPAASIEEAARMQVPGWNGDWTGDVWKAILHLRSTRTDLSTCVLDCDYGIGMVLKRPTAALLEFSGQITELHYSDLNANRAAYLGLRPPEHLWELLS